MDDLKAWSLDVAATLKELAKSIPDQATPAKIADDVLAAIRARSAASTTPLPPVSPRPLRPVPTTCTDGDRKDPVPIGGIASSVAVVTGTLWKIREEALELTAQRDRDRAEVDAAKHTRRSRPGLLPWMPLNLRLVW